MLVPTGETWVDQSGHTHQQVRGVERVVLTVMGLWPDGRRQILDCQAAEAEDGASWTQLFASLIQRGLAPERVQLVVSDGEQACRRQSSAVFLRRSSNAVWCIRCVDWSAPLSTTTSGEVGRTAAAGRPRRLVMRDVNRSAKPYTRSLPLLPVSKPNSGSSCFSAPGACAHLRWYDAWAWTSPVA